MDELFNKVEKARESLNTLVNITKSSNLWDISDYIDSLDEETCKHILRMIAYGSYRVFIVEEAK